MPYISQFFIDKIQDSLDLVTIINKYLQEPLKRSGAQYNGFSPFVKEQSPSFMVSPSKGVWKDFASGNGGNNAISFVMKLTGCSYPEAIEQIAGHLNMPVEYEDTKEAQKYLEQQQKKQELLPALMSTISHYHKLFKQLPATHPAKKEVYGKRGYNDQIVEDYQIGFAPGNKEIYNLCVEHGVKTEALELGLISEKGDKFFNRVIYPIQTKKGLQVVPVGMAGRTLDTDKGAKWINSQESQVYKKDQVFFGLDKALETIVKTNEAWLTEGYNDVIAWQTNGILNTVAGCGTAISLNQIKLLKKYCDRLVFCMDADKAGIKSMLKHIPLFFEQGFSVYTVELPDVDPDDFVRLYKKELKQTALSKLLERDFPKQDGFKFLLKHKIEGKQGVEKSKATQELCMLISNIPDDAMVVIYKEWLTKESGFKSSQIDKWVKEAKNVLTETAQQSLGVNSDGYFQLPPTVKEDVSALRPTIQKYQMFQANNQIWMQTGSEPPFKFRSVSNFSIEIIQHMNDEKYPMKLVRIENVFNQEKIFDVPSESFVSQQKFYIAVSNNGNYLWRGSQNDLLKLSAYLFDKMGVGSKIEELGWQPEGFWVWNNKVTIPGKSLLDIDQNGVIKIKNTSYYIPSANRIYANNLTKFMPQKNMVYLESKVNFLQYSTQFYRVHKGAAITGLLFTISAIFRDIVINKNLKMPLIFLYGQPGTGKDELIYCCQRFFGVPQSSIQIGSKLSTGKAQVRKFAQFNNLIVHLSEYRPGNEQLDETLKGFWDGNGYEVGTIESKYGTNTIPISSSVMITANHYPNDQALITRIVPDEMTNAVFSMDDKKEFSILQDMNVAGISHLTHEILQHREHFEKEYKSTYKRVYKATKDAINFDVPQDRMVQNVAVLCTGYELLKDKLTFPFSLAEIHDHLIKQLERQCRKLSSNSLIVKWWDCFLSCVNTQSEPLIHGREFEVKNDELFFNYTHCYNKITAKWWSQYHELAPSKSKASEILQADESFMTTKNSHRMTHSNSSVWVFDLTKTPILEDLNEAIAWKSQSNPFTNSPATPGDSEKVGVKSEQNELPF